MADTVRETIPCMDPRSKDRHTQKTVVVAKNTKAISPSSEAVRRVNELLTTS